jgi:hypothetical protein
VCLRDFIWAFVDLMRGIVDDDCDDCDCDCDCDDGFVDVVSRWTKS